MKNQREVTIEVPVKALIYEDNDGELVCGRAALPSLEDVMKAYEGSRRAITRIATALGLKTDVPTVELVNRCVQAATELRHDLELAVSRPRR